MHINVATCCCGKRPRHLLRPSRSVRETSAKNCRDSLKKIQKILIASDMQNITFVADFRYYTFGLGIIKATFRLIGNEDCPPDLDRRECRRCIKLLIGNAESGRRGLSCLLIYRSFGTTQNSAPSRGLRHLANYHNLAARASG